MALFVSIIIILLLLLIVGGVGRVTWWIWWKPKKLEKELRRQGINGTKYKILVGDSKDEVEAMNEAWSKPMDLNHNIVPRVLPHAHLMFQTYGKTSFKWFGTTPIVTIWEPKLLREILVNKDGNFVQPEREQWAQRRKMLKPAFHIDKLKEMVPNFQTSCIELIKKWQKLLSEESSCELDVWPELLNLTEDAISQTVFGTNFEEGKQVFKLQTEQITLAIEAASSIYLPGFRKFINNEIKRTLRDVIDKKKNNTITIDDVIEECKGFYLAGKDTTANLLTWMLILLSMHPIWQQKARDEVLQTCGENMPNFESLNRLKIVNMILHEVLRLYPSIIAQIRHTKKKTKLGDMILPAGVHVLIPTLQVHHDEEFWGEGAEEFNPERFKGGVSKASKGENAYFPFGWGPRLCLGQAFVMIQAKLGLAMVLQNFSFELSPSYAHAPSVSITLQPQFGAHIILRRL
ncbi:Secologanin synthase protein [Dioscorea alata]|uniref:Secologanin synthase protein n=1 Tax=Dioscorea alata TaxID=55571 RepID=A0ACB7UDG3_DIOAL|nr:Secologanin synthase protein [Dioscorea alata]